MMDRGERASAGRGWERHAPLTGVVAVVLWVIGAILLQSGGRADQEAAASEHLTFYAENEGKILLGAFLFGLGTLFFIWFLGSLRDRLYRGEGGTGRVSAIAWGGGLITAAMLLANLAPDIAAALTDDEVFAPAAAQALSVLTVGFFAAAELAAAVLTAATALAIWRTGVLPRWLALASAALALLLLIVPIGWLGLIFGLPLWVLIVSMLLYMQTRGPDRADAAAMARAA